MTTQPAPPAAPPAQGRAPAAVKARIISHMNADHALSLRLYLTKYCLVPLKETSGAAIQDITTQHMILTSTVGRHVIPLEPELTSLSEARERLVEMHQTCLADLDMSDVVIDSYTPPDRLWQGAMCILCICIITTFPFRDQFRPESGSLMSKIWSLGGTVPGLATLVHVLAIPVWWVVVVLHIGEAVIFARGRLRRHWVEVGTAVWYGWVLDILVQGGGCIHRFDRIVRGKQDKGTNGKH